MDHIEQIPHFIDLPLSSPPIVGDTFRGERRRMGYHLYLNTTAERGSRCRLQPGEHPSKTRGEFQLLWLSELLLQNLELNSFLELETLVHTKATEGERFYQSDVKPPFPDTPENWEDRLESAFTDIGER